MCALLQDWDKRVDFELYTEYGFFENANKTQHEIRFVLPWPRKRIRIRWWQRFRI